ncbi:hypothetical protein [uncultured Kordia sp.]|uniref:hypothetical protein n=1 Tax=uncultured Kordia sp. TaxID=507699 RepID=UPI0026111598|nr:hypothetical protein [uncultured Kordia sp.]
MNTYFFPDRLKKIRGSHTSINKKISEEISDELNWELHKKSTKIIIAKESKTWNHYGRQFVIIFDQNNVFIKCITFSKYSMQSPFHWYGNWKNEKRFKKLFLNKLAKN